MRQNIEDREYRLAMGRLLVMYTQIDYLIMCACAERIATAPDEKTRMSLAKQVGDECKHVRIQQQWIKQFGTDPTPVFSGAQQAFFLQHFRSLSWLDFLTDMYVCVEALGSAAVEQIVPMADPGTRESLKVPLQDEIDHIEFGLGQLRQELSTMPESEKQSYIGSISGRLDFLDDTLHDMGLDIPSMFKAVGADYQLVVDTVMQHRQDILEHLSIPKAA
jgi:hypothetical protein